MALAAGNGLSAAAVIAHMRLQPHPEGGHYRECFRSPPLAPKSETEQARAAMTAIYYLLAAGERSHWHRVTDADEIWHFYAGAPLRLQIATDQKQVSTYRLGGDFMAGEDLHVVVPRGAWQAAESCGAWTLVGCTVAPGFIFERFEMAPPGWSPGP